MAEEQEPLGADNSIREWLTDPRGNAALAATLAAAGISLETVRPLSGFTLRSLAAMVGPPLEPVETFVQQARTFTVPADPGDPTHWATVGLGRQPSRRMSV